MEGRRNGIVGEEEVEGGQGGRKEGMKEEGKCKCKRKGTGTGEE